MVLSCFWEKDPDNEFSLPCTAFNPETGEIKRYPSITKCGDDILEKDCLSAQRKISEAIKCGNKINGFVITEDKSNFQNVNDPRMSRFVGDKKRPVFKVDLEAENIIEKYDSCFVAAIPLLAVYMAVSGAAFKLRIFHHPILRNTQKSSLFSLAQTCPQNH